MRVSAAARSVSGARLQWLDEPGLRTVALQAIRIAETERFCPDLEPSATAQSQLICLRPYRMSASAGCRAAIKAASLP